MYPLPGNILGELCPACLKELQERLEERIRAATPIEQYAKEREATVSQCQLTKMQWVREKPGGKKVRKAMRVCGMAAQDGSAYCPRHTFLHNVAAENDRQKAAAKREAEIHGVAGKLPPTRASLMRDGYEYKNDGECSGCGKPIEWWRTKNGRVAPFDPMPFETSFVKSHFATCTQATEFRRAS